MDERWEQMEGSKLEWMLCTVFIKEEPISNVWNLKVDGLDSNGRFTETNQEKKKLPGAEVEQL